MTGEDDEPTLEVANEFSLVRVRRVHTHNGVRLEIAAPRVGQSILLDPLELEALTWHSHGLFTQLLETPFGPEGGSE